MAVSDLVNLSGLMDDAKCFAFVRQRRWPEGIRRPACDNGAVVRDGHGDTQPRRQRCRCKACSGRFDDLAGLDAASRHLPPGDRCAMVLAGHHQPLRAWVLCLHFMGLDTSDVQAMTEQLRRGLVAKAPAVGLTGEVRAGCEGIQRDRRGPRGGRAQGPAGGGGQKGRLGRCRRLAGAPGRGRLAKHEPPVPGLIQRGGQGVLRRLARVQQRTVKPVITRAVTAGTLVHTDEHGICARLPAWGCGHKTVCHGRGEHARDEDGGGSCEVHVNTAEGFWSLLRSWLRPHRGISQDKLPLYLGFFQFVHNARRRGKALLGAPIAGLVA